MTAASRQDTISRAIALIDTASPADLKGYLAGTRIHARLQADPAGLRDTLAGAIGTDMAFGAWKASQQILAAAGIPA
jgi:hypothetical protein